MKKALLFIPLIANILFSCNKQKDVTYLELFSKQTDYFNDEIQYTFTTKIENKRYIEKCEVRYSDDHEPLVERKESYTYNAHGDYAKVTVETKEPEIEESSYETYEYAYFYQKDGLIDWKEIKHTDENEEVTYNKYIYEYDDLKRLTSEIRATSNDGYEYATIYTSTSSYEKDFTTYTTNTVWDIKDPVCITITHNKFNNDDYVTEKTIKKMDESMDITISDEREVYTYDKHHCMTHIDSYETSDEVEKLYESSDCIYYKNNPNKLLTRKNTFYDTNGKIEIIQVDYTYDKYDRKISKTSQNERGRKHSSIWEYDQLIKA